MDRRSFLQRAAVAAAFAGGGCLCAAGARRSNFVYILTDDQGWSELSFALDPGVLEGQSAYLNTPNMARLARSGMRFASGYAPAPLCTPTRRAVLCGTTAARSGSEFRSTWVPAEHMTIPRALKQADSSYRCAHFGKWGEQMISTPAECGYDADDGMTGNVTGGMPNSLGYTNHNDAPPHVIDNDDPKRTPSVTGRAAAFMEAQVEEGHPFYVQVSYYATHLSVVCRESTLARYEGKGTPDRGYTAAWAAMLDDLDEGVGRLLDTLERLGVAETTYVAFMSDNGGRGTVPGGDAERLPTNHPLTGAKHSLYEGGIRVPFMISGPGIPAGAVCSVPVAGYDLLPTFYDLAGGKAPLPNEVDGVSLRPLLSNPGATAIKRPMDALVFHRPNRRRMSAFRRGRHKLVVHWTAQGAIRARELYDLGESPVEEGRDMAAEMPELAEQLQKDLLAYLDSVGAEKAMPAPRRRR